MRITSLLLKRKDFFSAVRFRALKAITVASALVFTYNVAHADLAAPALSSPANNAVDQSASVSLSWNSVTDATSYEVQVATDTSFATGKIFLKDTNVMALSKGLSGVTTSDMFYWRVRAKNSSTTGVWSSIRGLTGGSYIAPQLYYPANGTTGVALSNTLYWIAVTGVNTYQVEVTTDSTFTNSAAFVLNDLAVTGNTKTLYSLQGSTTYYWRVRARTSTLRGARSQVWKFTTQSGGNGGGGGSLATPTLTSPGTGASSQATSSLTLSWNSVTNATKYEVEISTDAAFGSFFLKDTNISTNSKQISSLSSATTYYWHVRAKNSSVKSSWSSVYSFTTSQPQQLPTNPIMFVTQVPLPDDFTTIGSAFGNHRGDMNSAPRGGDLYIRYPDGTLKNLTATAGYGVSGQAQTGVSAIAVREPSVYWDGTKALFSMVVGASSSQYDATKFYWQIYEVTNLGQNQTPVITKVANQPANFNNISPIYGTDDKIIFTSDRPRNGAAHLYPQLDEYERAPINSGLWSLDPATGNLVLLDHAPSGDFSPSIDSYGRVIFTRWDHLQRDQEADIDFLANTNSYGSFNYSSEAANAQVLRGDITEVYPEKRYSTNGSNVNGHTFNQFFPWQVNEDGSEAETINHVGRHDLFSGYLNVSFNDDNNLKSLVSSYSGAKSYIRGMMQMREDPTRPGVYYGIDAPEFFTHASGQIITMTGAPSLDPMDMAITYVTSPATRSFIDDTAAVTSNNTGHYRNPLPLSNGSLLAIQTDENRIEKNMGTTSAPVARYKFRLKTMKQVGSYWQADTMLTPGFSKTVTYWSNGVSTTVAGQLWELNPVEVVSRTKPSTRVAQLDTIETQVISEEGIDKTVLQQYLKRNNVALVVTRNVTNRNSDDKQQPYFLKVANSTTQSPNATGKIYTVGHAQFFQADQLRGGGLYNQNSTPRPGRRVLAQPMHDPAVSNPANANGPTGSVKIASDGSIAAIVPAHRAMTWQLSDTTGTPVVRERYWVSFKAGEIRACNSCHGQNDFAASPKQTVPQNKPAALRTLLQFLKAQATGTVTLASPANDTMNIPSSFSLKWNETPVAASYQVQLSTDSTFAITTLDVSDISTNTQNFAGLSVSTKYFWRVRPTTLNGVGSWSAVRRFTISPTGATTTGDPSDVTEQYSSGLELNIAPNPVSDFATITFESVLKTIQNSVHVDIIDERGATIAGLFNGEGPELNSVIFYTGKIPNGVYYCRFESNGRSVVRKFIIAR